jgi:cell division protein FtsB
MFVVVLLRKLLYCVGCVSNTDESRSRRRGPNKGSSPGRTRRLVHILLLFIASVIVVDGLVGDRGLLAMQRARKDNDAMAAAIAGQRAENARLREVVRRLREDPSAIEEIARRELGLIRPGERLFIVKDVLPPKH